MKIQKRRLPKFIDINTFDFTPYGRELTREEAYLVNGGQVMTPEDQYAMAKAHERGDQAAMDAIVAKYERKDEPEEGQVSPVSNSSSGSDTPSQETDSNTTIPMSFDTLPRPEGTMSPDEQAMMAMYDEMKKTGAGRNMQYGTIAGYVVNKEGAKNFGHAGWFVQTYNNKFVFFEVIGISEATNGLDKNISPGTTKSDYNGKDTTVLSNSPVGKATMPLAVSSGSDTQAGCIARVYDSKEEMIAALEKMEFDEMVVFNTNSVQNAYIYDESVKLGKSFSGYELITNSCGIAARNSLTVEGSGINCYFDSPVPNFIDDDLSASNNNCWREKI